ncbi:hypothetical protein CYPRO_1797 [Cyclonatronum proteinivorum]|uniref:DUF4412 domain-containing protein n=1 Tax=Cyclonatronum proteinivorum TaxID=1457365 RepID=A0A345UKP5_9BACT|nr:hypothetical protein [Cyclonatronum proteinivorum]AXJ01047.1 hypothetical protein CYPRO_1797 [Cyclonatronum proteinivorum]
MITSEFRSALAVLLLVLCAPLALQAQHFEGEISFTFTDTDDNTTEKLEMLVAENRLVVRGNIREYVDLPLFQELITIRADRNDVLIHTDDAVSAVNLGELTAVIRQFMNNNRNSQPQQQDRIADRTRIEETRETRRIHGMTARKFILHDLELESRETHLWLAEAGIDWEQLLSPIDQLLRTIGGGVSLSSVNWPLSMTPLLVEDYNNGTLRGKMEVTHLQRRALTADERDIPSNKRQISLFELMMGQF